jgi:hypothetical protein
VTFGQSFHWTDEQQVAEVVYDMLEPGGAVHGTLQSRNRPARPTKAFWRPWQDTGGEA